MPRIIAGTAKRMQLKTPTGESTRPTSDRVKEALFSMINPRLYQADILDLYAGSGQIGLEALSRGAASVHFVEADRRCAKILKENLQHCHLEENAQVYEAEVGTVLRKLVHDGLRFDLIYLDPPWRLYPDCLIDRSDFFEKLLNVDGILIAEHPKECLLPSRIGSFTAFRTCQYGGTMLSFYKVETVGQAE